MHDFDALLCLTVDVGQTCFTQDGTNLVNRGTRGLSSSITGNYTKATLIKVALVSPKEEHLMLLFCLESRRRNRTSVAQTSTPVQNHLRCRCHSLHYLYHCSSLLYY